MNPISLFIGAMLMFLIGGVSGFYIKDTTSMWNYLTGGTVLFWMSIAAKWGI